jgi:hypothetical protein
MKRRGWLIVGGLAFLWIAPAILTLVRSSSAPKEDQTKAWSAYFRAERKRQHDYAMEVYRGKYYSGSYSSSSSSAQPEPDVEVVVVERPVYIEREAPIPDYQPRRQPDLTGFYSTIPMTGPNAGELQINSVIGPF